MRAITVNADMEPPQPGTLKPHNFSAWSQHTSPFFLAATFSLFAYRHGYFNPLNFTLVSAPEKASGTPQAITAKLEFHAEFDLTEYTAYIGHAFATSHYRTDFHLDSRLPPAMASVALLELPRLQETDLEMLAKAFKKAQAKLWLVHCQDGERCHMHWLCDNEDPAFAGPLALRFEAWLEDITAQPDVPLHQHPLGTADEQKLLARSLVAAHQPRDFTPVLQLFEQHVTHQPQAAAVCCNGVEWNYAQLNSRANALAASLQQQGATAGDMIAVCLPVQVEILQALLAIHKLGAVYVPIDPTLPAARVKAMCSTCAPRFMIGLGTTQTLCPQGCAFIALDQLTPEQLAAFEAAWVQSYALTARDLSHIFFTSGTTGTPKAVLATQGNLQHYVLSAVERYGFNASDRFVAAARFTFSISLFELLVPLAAGASVELLPREQVLDTPRLIAALGRATTFHFGPSLLKTLLPEIQKHCEQGILKNIRHASSGGDMVPSDVLNTMRQVFPAAEIYVIYGSSEISCMGCTWQVPPAPAPVATRVGRPFANVEVAIRDPHGNPVPPGVAGLLTFTGPGVVQGYLNLPQLTAERFTGAAGNRSYQIGDIGRLDSDGFIELLGREDFQVQVRGMRVELAEIEQNLKRHPTVADCLVAARTLPGHSEASLVCYLVPAANQEVSARVLAQYLGQYLPDYMLPTLYVALERLPTNHNNKIDRSALPMPTPENVLLSDAFAGAADETEQALLDILSRVTGMDNIGTTHNFFELGGDSLQAVQFLTAVDQQYQKFIPISYLYSNPTVKALARVVRGDVAMPGAGEVVVLRPGDIQEPLFCLYGVLLYRDLALSLNTRRPICGVYLAEEIALMHDDAGLESVQNLLNVDTIAERYIESITRYQPQGPYYLCGESFGGIVALEVARKLKARGEAVALVAMFDTTAPGFLQALKPFQRALLHLKQLLTNKTYLAGKLRRMGRNPEARGPVSVVTDHNRANARHLASRNYQPETFHDEVLLMIARERSPFEPSIPDLGWRKYIPNLKSFKVNGDHLSMLQKGNVEDMAAHLSGYLAARESTGKQT